MKKINELVKKFKKWISSKDKERKAINTPDYSFLSSVHPYLRQFFIKNQIVKIDYEDKSPDVAFYIISTPAAQGSVYRFKDENSYFAFLKKYDFFVVGRQGTSDQLISSGRSSDSFQMIRLSLKWNKQKILRDKLKMIESKYIYELA